jgi:hypothetical protein
MARHAGNHTVIDAIPIGGIKDLVHSHMVLMKIAVLISRQIGIGVIVFSERGGIMAVKA